MRSVLTVVFLGLFSLVAHGGRLQVFVSVCPQEESVRFLGGDQVEVTTLVTPGANPETFSPGPRMMSALAHADLYVTIGAPFEHELVKKIRRSFPTLRVVDGTQGMVFRLLEHDEGHCHHYHHHEEDDEGEHDGHDEHDPHVWLSIANMKIHAQNVHRELKTMLPVEDQAALEQRAQEYQRQLDGLAVELKQKLASLRGMTILVFHPAFGYFLDEYGIKQQAVELEGKEPGGHYLGNVIRQAREAGIKVIYVQPQFNAKAAEVISNEIHGKTVPFDPLPRKFSEGLRQLSECLRP